LPEQAADGAEPGTPADINGLEKLRRAAVSDAGKSHHAPKNHLSTNERSLPSAFELL
jgi:hypothetical protein